MLYAQKYITKAIIKEQKNLKNSKKSKAIASIISKIALLIFAVFLLVFTRFCINYFGSYSGDRNTIYIQESGGEC